MKMLEISKEKFEEFAKKSKYNNYCQTANYGILMSELGYEYSFIAYTTNEDDILAAGMFLTKKIGKAYYYSYCPKGFIIDYSDEELVRKFTRNLIKYYKKNKIIFLKINPEIQIATLDQKNDFKRVTNENTSILENLKSLGFKKRKELYPLELLQPKLTATIELKKYDLNKLDKNVYDKINLNLNNGLDLVETDSSSIEKLCDFIKPNQEEDLNYYRNLYNTFKKTENTELLMLKMNYETYLINSKKRVEEEQIRNEQLNERLRNETNDNNLIEKMNSDKELERYKLDVIYATEGLKKNEETYIAGALIVKFDNKISIIASGIDDKFDYLYPEYYLYHKIFEKYKDDYEIIDLNAIADDFSEDSKYKDFNKTKLDFDPIINESIGELDLVISDWRFKIVEKNNLLSNEFKKRY